MACNPRALYAALRQKGIPVAEDDTESIRLSLLRSLNLLDTSDSTDNFDRITRIVRSIVKVPISLVSLVDLERQWFLSNVTLMDETGTSKIRETPRELAFCNYAIDPDLATDLFVVLDATKDPRFANNDLVAGYPYIRFYAGAPLLYTAPGGEVLRLGSLCAIDTEPHEELSLEHKQMLLDLAALVVDEIKLRTKLNQDMMTAQARYIASTAHNLRTPLMVFELSMALLQQSDVSPAQEEPVRYAQMGIEMMRMTVENSISIAQSLLPAESSAVALSPTIEPLRVQHIQAKMEHLAGQLFAFEVPVRWDVDPEAAGAVVHTDESVLTHCMLNLFSNACKHTSQGAITVKISLAAAENAEGLGRRRLRVEVADTGRGLPEKRNSLFEPFAEQDSVKEGTGLGLYSMRFQVHSIGGRLGCEPNAAAGSGSIFWFELPDLHGHDKAGASPAATELVASPPTRYSEKRKRSPPPSLEAKNDIPVPAGVKSALIIDDSPMIRLLLAKVLNNIGIAHIEHASNGSEGLLLLTRNRCYTVVFLDFLMPIMHGLECITRFRKWEAAQQTTDGSKKHQYVVGISANASEQDVASALSAGMDRYINKPFTLKLVQDIVEKAEDFARHHQG